MKLAPNEVLKKVRKTCGLSQDQLARALKIEQASISRIENGSQAIQLDFLVALAEFYRLKIDQLISGEINYYALAKSFNREPKVKAKYRSGQRVYAKEVLPIIFFIRRNHGDEVIESILDKFKMEDIIFMPPSETVSARFLIDLVNHSMENHLIGPKDIPLVIHEGLNQRSLGSVYESFKEQASVFGLINSWFYQSKSLELFFKHEIILQEEHRLTMACAYQNEEILKDVKKAQVNDFFLRLKEDYFKALFAHFDKGITKLKISGDLLSSTGINMELTF